MELMRGAKFLLPLAALLLLLLQLVVLPSEGALQCSDVLQDLSQCTGYLTSGGTPSSGCCAGVSQLASAAATAADRRTACSCIQNLAQAFRPSVSAAAALPGLCGLSLPITISPNVDCSKIS